MMQLDGVVEFNRSRFIPEGNETEPTGLEEWMGALTLEAMMGGDSDLISCLFGVNNHAGFKPLFPLRGLPEDKSYFTADRFQQDPIYPGPTWITFAELAAVDWDEVALRRDEQVSMYRADSNGDVIVMKMLIPPPEVDVALEEQHEVVVGGYKYRREIMRRRDVLIGSGFPTVMKLMAVLAEEFGAENVRVVLWFC